MTANPQDPRKYLSDGLEKWIPSTHMLRRCLDGSFAGLAILRQQLKLVTPTNISWRGLKHGEQASGTSGECMHGIVLLGTASMPICHLCNLCHPAIHALVVACAGAASSEQQQPAPAAPNPVPCPNCLRENPVSGVIVVIAYSPSPCSLLPASL